MRTKLSMCLLVFLLLPGAARAQAGTKVFTSPDGSFTFVYPAGWYAIAPDENSEPMSARISISNFPGDKYKDSADGLQVLIAYPQKRAYYHFVDGATTPTEIVANSVKSGQPRATFEFGTPPANGTPELLDLQPASLPVTEFSVNGNPAARIIDPKISLGFDNGFMVVVVDVGQDFLVSLVANAPKGGIDLVRRYEALILAIAQTLRYTPPTVYSGNPDLPQVYSGTIGVWQRGNGRFFYPANWVVFTFATVFVQNTPDYVDAKAPQTGQVTAVVEGPSELRVGFDPGALFD